MRCPGQDMRYWKEDAVFEVPCPKCGCAVEFFKDESSGRCSSCGLKFENPKLDFQCAEWCAYAEECLGFAPSRQSPSHLGEGALASRLIQAVKEVFEEDQAQITRALVVFRHAKQLACREGGDLRVVLAAALLLKTADPGLDCEQTSPRNHAAKAKQILEGFALGEEVIQRVCQTIANCRAGTQLDTIEAKVVHDADTLAELASVSREGDLKKLESIIHSELATPAGKERAQAFFLS